MKKTVLGKTNLKKFDNMKDSDINFDDIPELDDTFFKNALLKLPEKQSVTIRLDTDVVDWFRQQGKGYQTRINKLLRSYMETHAK
ncbi:MAG: BrnA antitoxin family protein [Proteobacteria bacterium]|nr:3-oxoacyl-ACP synthase [Pseudomonadota bacterium]NOG59019.1 BrnA antitoxin family protein [Pseudomonadota bacterium]